MNAGIALSVLPESTLLAANTREMHIVLVARPSKLSVDPLKRGEVWAISMLVHHFSFAVRCNAQVRQKM